MFSCGGAALDAAIARAGEIPLPPYIAGKRAADARDDTDYQTMFARAPGSVAAPTAGLHFTPGLVSELAAVGATTERLTLHVGAGTFLPVSFAAMRRHCKFVQSCVPVRYVGPSRCEWSHHKSRQPNYRMCMQWHTSVRASGCAVAPRGYAVWR